MTETAIQQVTPEDVKQAILTLIRENNAELKAILREIPIPAKIKDSAKRKKKKSKDSKSKDRSITIIEGSRIPYSEMPFWKANPHLKSLVLTKKNHRPAKGDFATAMKQAQEVFSDLDVTDEEWLMQILD